MISINRDHVLEQSSSCSFSIRSSLEDNRKESILRKRKCSRPGTKNYEEYPDSDDEEFENLYDSLKVICEKGMGKGVKTTIQLKKNTLLGEYTGKRLTYTKAYEKMKHKSVHYIVRTDLRSRYIDGEGKEGNILKYINHKCIDSNCEMVKLTRGRVGISTKRDICADELLNYNYKLAYFKDVPKTAVKCVCRDDCPNSL